MDKDYGRQASQRNQKLPESVVQGFVLTCFVSNTLLCLSIFVFIFAKVISLCTETKNQNHFGWKNRHFWIRKPDEYRLLISMVLKLNISISLNHSRYATYWNTHHNTIFAQYSSPIGRQRHWFFRYETNFFGIQSNSNHTRPVLIFQFFSAYVSYAYSSDRFSLTELENQNG